MQFSPEKRRGGGGKRKILRIALDLGGVHYPRWKVGRQYNIGGKK